MVPSHLGKVVILWSGVILGRVSLYSPDWPGTLYVHHASHRDFPASGFGIKVLGLKVCTTDTLLFWKYLLNPGAVMNTYSLSTCVTRVSWGILEVSLGYIKWGNLSYKWGWGGKRERHTIEIIISWIFKRSFSEVDMCLIGRLLAWYAQSPGSIGRAAEKGKVAFSKVV